MVIAQIQKYVTKSRSRVLWNIQEVVEFVGQQTQEAGPNVAELVGPRQRYSKVVHKPKKCLLIRMPNPALVSHRLQEVSRYYLVIRARSQPRPTTAESGR